MIEPSKIASYSQQTPQRIATSIVFADSYSWVVRCEGNQCATEIRVSKTTYVPADFSTLVKDLNDMSYNCVAYTDPEARVCIACGPNGSRWQGWPWDRFTYAKLARELGLAQLTQQLRFVTWAGHEESDLWTLVSDGEAIDLRNRFELGSFDMFII